MDELNTVSKPVKFNKSHQVKLWVKCRNFHYLLIIKYVIWYVSTECWKECCSRFMQLLRPVLHNLWLGSFWPFRHQRFLIYKKKTSWTRHNRHGNMHWILLELIQNDFDTETIENFRKHHFSIEICSLKVVHHTFSIRGHSRDHWTLDEVQTSYNLALTKSSGPRNNL